MRQQNRPAAERFRDSGLTVTQIARLGVPLEHVLSLDDIAQLWCFHCTGGVPEVHTGWLPESKLLMRLQQDVSEGNIAAVKRADENMEIFVSRDNFEVYLREHLGAWPLSTDCLLRRWWTCRG